MCVEDPLHSCGGFEVLKAEDKSRGLFTEPCTAVANEFVFLNMHLKCSNNV